MLRSCAIQPSWPILGFKQEASGNGNCDHGIFRIIEVMIGNPTPDIFKIAIGFGCNVEEHGSGDAATRDTRNLGAIG